MGIGTAGGALATLLGGPAEFGLWRLTGGCGGGAMGFVRALVVVGRA